MADVGFEALVKSLVLPIVSEKGAVTVEEKRSDSAVAVSVSVSPADVGRVIGSRGATAAAIRKVVEFAASRSKVRATLDVVEG